MDVIEGMMNREGGNGSAADLSRYSLCNLSQYAELALCNNNRTIMTGMGNITADYSHLYAMQRLLSVVVPIIFGLIVIVGLIGNALVVVVVAANQQMRNTTNLLIINLAMADLLFIIFCVPFTATDYALTYWPFSDIWCKIVQYLVVVTAYASVYTLVLMSLDRFLAVVHPITSMSIRTEANTYLAITVTWLVILIACTPLLLTHGKMNYFVGLEEYSVCVFLFKEGWSHHAFQITFFVTSYLLPLLLICGLYLCMLMRLWRGVAPGGRVSAESRRGKKRVTRMVIIVVVIFAVCWCPIQLLLVLKSVGLFEPNTSLSVIIQITSHVLAYMNSCVNPVLYAFLSDNFRKAFRKVVYCRSIGFGKPNGDARQPNNNGEKCDIRQPLFTNTTNTTNVNLRGTMVRAVPNGETICGPNEAVDIL